MAGRSAKLPPTVPEELRSQDKIVAWIAELTKQSEELVRIRLRQEFENPGVNVARALGEAGLQPYVWCDGMAEFYKQTDAFLYELVIWNRNKLKRRIRRWVARYLAHSQGRPVEILSIGDGLGFDSLYLAQTGHRVTYFEVPGYTQSFARKLFAEHKENLTVLADQNSIPPAAYDVVLCLDVLEHVPEPPVFVKQIAGYLRPSGQLITHAPFYMIHPSNPTHLKANRRYSGSLSLYQKQGLKLVDGDIGWNPIVLKKLPEDSQSRCSFSTKVLGLRLAGLYLALGRFSTLPFWWVDAYRRKKNRWFETKEQ